MSNKLLGKNAANTTILVTGGAGFIGSHTVVELLDLGYKVVVVDNLSNSSEESLNRVRAICGIAPDDDRLEFYNVDILDKEGLERVFDENEIDAIIHFAGLKAVGESVEKPLEYYQNNIAGTLVLADVAREHGVKNIIFSSSATVYGEPDEMPLTEHSPKRDATNPYGWTKSMLEQILRDLYIGDNEWNVVLLRYFNPIGAHESGLIGENPKGIPNNLAPYVAQVAVGKLDKLGVFGDDYDTHDGTGIRDYIHVVDLARGHVAALEWMAGKRGSDKSDDDPYSLAGNVMPDGTRTGVGVFNLGTGKGSSVLDVVGAFEKASGKKIPYEVMPRRAGDIAESYAACEKAANELEWTTEYDLERMCEDIWRWQSANPNGFDEA